MAHAHEAHTWECSYEHQGSTYRECAVDGCDSYQEWICTLDRWSDAFETPSPRKRAEQPVPGRPETP